MWSNGKSLFFDSGFDTRSFRRSTNECFLHDDSMGTIRWIPLWRREEIRCGLLCELKWNWLLTRVFMLQNRDPLSIRRTHRSQMRMFHKEREEWWFILDRACYHSSLCFHSLAVTEPLISLTSMAITNSAFVYCETDSNTSLNLRSQSEGLSALFHINPKELKLNDFLCARMPIHLEKFVLANSIRKKNKDLHLWFLWRNARRASGLDSCWD